MKPAKVSISFKNKTDRSILNECGVYLMHPVRVCAGIMLIPATCCDNKLRIMHTTRKTSVTFEKMRKTAAFMVRL